MGALPFALQAMGAFGADALLAAAEAKGRGLPAANGAANGHGQAPRLRLRVLTHCNTGGWGLFVWCWKGTDKILTRP